MGRKCPNCGRTYSKNKVMCPEDQFYLEDTQKRTQALQEKRKKQARRSGGD